MRNDSQVGWSRVRLLSATLLDRSSYNCSNSPLADIHLGSVATVGMPGCLLLLRRAPGLPRYLPHNRPAALPPPPKTAGRLTSPPGLRGGRAKLPAHPWRRWSAHLPLIALLKSARPPALRPAGSCHPPPPWLLQIARLLPSFGCLRWPDHRADSADRVRVVFINEWIMSVAGLILGWGVGGRDAWLSLHGSSQSAVQMKDPFIVHKFLFSR